MMYYNGSGSFIRGLYLKVHEIIKKTGSCQRVNSTSEHSKK